MNEQQIKETRAKIEKKWQEEGKPKDFDVVTDATPEQVKELFRNCRVVGRRFRLAHVMFGREVIEVEPFEATTAVLTS